MKRLNENLKISWSIYANYLKDSIKNGSIAEAIRFTETLEQPELSFLTSPFPIYWALLYAYDRQTEKAFEIVRKAHEYGNPAFWYFNSDSHGWADKTSEDYLLLKPIHENASIQEYVRSSLKSYTESWELDVARTPFCWFEKKELTRTKARCNLSKKKLQKGDIVYEYRYFCGGGDISSEPYFADIEAFENNASAMKNLNNFTNRTYALEDYAIRIEYNHPLLNFFWNRIYEFDLLKTLTLIANPPTNPTPYIEMRFDEDPLSVFDPTYDEIEKREPINRGTGGEFLNLLYVLVQCGYGSQIVNLFPLLPEYFPYLFLFFRSENVRALADGNINANVKELFPLLDIAFKSYHKKTPEEIRALASFGKKNPHFLKNLATCLNIYECHLYSNYRPGANWFFSEFSQFIFAKGGGLLDFFITEPELIPSLSTMKSKTCLIDKVTSASDAYKNALPLLYRTITFHLAYSKDPTLQTWLDLPIRIRNNPYEVLFKKVHNHTLKTIEKLGKIGFEI